MAYATPPGSRTDRRHLYAEACKRNYKLMHKVSEFSVQQRRRDAAFKPSMAAQDSMQNRSRAQGLSPVVRMDATPYIGINMSIIEQNWPIAASRVRREVIPASSIRGIVECLGSLVLSAMPRSRGVPRRGGRSGTRVGLDMEDLQPIAPIASAPPSSPSSEQECLLPQGTYQTFRFRFPSRLVRPEVVVNFTVFISEEEPGMPNSNSPASASVQDSDILLGDMNGLVYRAHRYEEAPAQNALVQQAPTQEISGHAASVQEVLPPPNSNMEMEVFSARAQPVPGELPQDVDGMVIWLDSPSQDNGTQKASTSQTA